MKKKMAVVTAIFYIEVEEDESVDMDITTLMSFIGLLPEDMLNILLTAHVEGYNDIEEKPKRAKPNLKVVK